MYPMKLKFCSKFLVPKKFCYPNNNYEIICVTKLEIGDGNNELVSMNRGWLAVSLSIIGHSLFWDFKWEWWIVHKRLSKLFEREVAWLILIHLRCCFVYLCMIYLAKIFITEKNIAVVERLEAVIMEIIKWALLKVLILNLHPLSLYCTRLLFIESLFNQLTLHHHLLLLTELTLTFILLLPLTDFV